MQHTTRMYYSNTYRLIYYGVLAIPGTAATSSEELVYSI